VVRSSLAVSMLVVLVGSSLVGVVVLCVEEGMFLGVESEVLGLESWVLGFELVVVELVVVEFVVGYFLGGRRRF